LIEIHALTLKSDLKFRHFKIYAFTFLILIFYISQIFNLYLHPHPDRSQWIVRRKFIIFATNNSYYDFYICFI